MYDIAIIVAAVGLFGLVGGIVALWLIDRHTARDPWRG
jgi:Na+/glutamate symporter